MDSFLKRISKAALSCPSHSLLREIAKKKKLISNNHEVFVKVEKI